MGGKFQFPFDNNRIMWLIVLLFASVLVVQHFDLPYGIVVSSLFSAGKPSSSHISTQNDVHGLANFSSSLDKISKYPVNNSASSDKNGGTMMRNNSLETHKVRDLEFEHLNTIVSSTFESFQGGNNASSFEKIGKLNASIPSSTYDASPPYEDATPGNIERNKKNTSVSFVSNSTAVDKNAVFGQQQIQSRIKEGEVLSIRELNDMFQKHTSFLPNLTKWSLSSSDQQLLNARAQIEKVTIDKDDDDSGLYAPLYWNISRFKRSYELMEQTLKIYIYKEGKRPVFHQPSLKGIYSSEGWFMKLLKESKQYVTTNPAEAHLFYLPFSSQRLEETIYVPKSRTFDKLKEYLRNYLDMIKARYTFWNRTSGADHFLVACHDWAPDETKRLMANCVRALCNADMKVGFQLGKDASLPETYVHRLPPGGLEGKPASQRKILAFFAGKMHGYVRPLLLKHWENKDSDMKIVALMHMADYIQHMKSSKYCICARGYEVNSPRLVEAIMFGCVPVIISDNFVPPFFEVLNWEKFAIFVLEKDIPNLKTILLSISNRRYFAMHQRGKQVRQHFLWHSLPQKYDIFHMILHSIWYNRVFQ